MTFFSSPFSELRTHDLLSLFFIFFHSCRGHFCQCNVQRKGERVMTTREKIKRLEELLRCDDDDRKRVEIVATLRILRNV